MRAPWGLQGRRSGQDTGSRAPRGGRLLLGRNEGLGKEAQPPTPLAYGNG